MNAIEMDISGMYNIYASKPKLCYIAPRYAENDATHFSHLYDFVEEAAKRFDIFLIIEHGETPQTNFGCTKVVVIKAIPLVNNILLKFRIFQAWFLGYKNFYVHYSFKSAWIASCLTRVFGGRVFYWNCGEPWKYTRGILREMFERMVYAIVTYVVTGTEGLKKQYAKTYRIPELKILVMPNWISLARFAPDGGALRLKLQLGIPADAKVILFAHRLSKRKGAHSILGITEAFKNENVVMVVAGEGPEQQGVEQRAKSLELGNKLKFVGSVPNRQMPLYYSMADVFIMPSDEDGFPRVILESMAMGVPFVSFDVGGIKEFVPPELLGLVVPHGDSEGFVRAVRAMLTASPQKLNEIQAIERSAVRQFETKEVVKRFYEIVIAKE